MPATNRSKILAPTAAQLAEGMIISVGEARKLLGAEATNLSDDEIAVFILEFSDMAQDLLKYKHFIK